VNDDKDVHVMPVRAPPDDHESSRDCWCGPSVDEGAHKDGNGRLWVHNDVQRKKEVCDVQQVDN
jgi:hypothetical protein